MEKLKSFIINDNLKNIQAMTSPDYLDREIEWMVSNEIEDPVNLIFNIPSFDPSNDAVMEFYD